MKFEIRRYRTETIGDYEVLGYVEALHVPGAKLAAYDTWLIKKNNEQKMIQAVPVDVNNE
jgi:hypothetical protein